MAKYPPTGQRNCLQDKRVLLVEDEYYIADDLRRTLAACGATIAGPYGTVEAAQKALTRNHFDCAVVDLNLHGESAAPIADRLLADGRSFAIATGYGASAVPERLTSVPRLEKPYDADTVVKLVSRLARAA